MAIPLSELNHAEGDYGNERGKPSLEYDGESTSTEAEEQEPFINLSIQNTPTLESQEASADSPTKYGVLAKLGYGIGWLIVGVLVFFIGATVIVAVITFVLKLLFALWRKIGLGPS
ncbi:hypothetical protein F4814DRAFT_428948 [Daldinia grandis]|nr:hypothetical protein F4814DRAFT_428948 [Daldinia grandis]